MEKIEVNYQLRNVLTYAKRGNPEQTASIIIPAPSMEVFDEAIALSQLVMSCFMDARRFATDTSNEQTEQIEKNITAKEVKPILFSAVSVKISDVSKAFIDLLVKSGKLDEDGTKITRDLVKQININDNIDMMCEYIANFTVPSLLSMD